MKIAMTKHGMTRYCQDYEQELLTTAGWQVVQDKAGEEVIRLKPTVKSKATVTAVEEANITIQGDE